jgi:lysophospholipase L1-like esterase
MIKEDLNTSVTVHICARSGLTTKEILHMIDQPFCKQQLTKSNIITITAGGNDLIDAVLEYQNNHDERIFLETLLLSRDHFRSILTRIAELKKGKPNYIIRISNLYNPLPDVPLAEKWISRFNNHLQQLALSPHVKIANLYAAFQNHTDAYLSRDNIHPNSLGYQVIAKEMRKTGYKPLGL